MPLTGRWRRYFLIACGYFLLVCRMAGELGGANSYCGRCGLHRHKASFYVFDGGLLEWTRYQESPYSRLYAQFVDDPCKHQWRFNGWGRRSLLGGRYRCSFGLPKAFRDRWPVKDLPAVARLSDVRMIRTMLCSLPNDQALSDHPGDFADALRALKTINGPEQERAWWKQYGKLFPPAPGA